jgi:hypothetical protein
MSSCPKCNPKKPPTPDDIAKAREFFFETLVPALRGAEFKASDMSDGIFSAGVYINNEYRNVSFLMPTEEGRTK